MKHELTETARKLIGEIASQHPAFQNYITGFCEGKELPPGQGTLVIDAAHVETPDAEETDALR